MSAQKIITKTYKDFLKEERNQHFIIYGAGVVGYCIAKEMIKNRLPYYIDCFMVSNKKGNVENYFGIPVKSYIECEKQKEMPIIVGTLERLQEEIIEFLLENGFYNIYLLQEEEYREIRKDLFDSEAEIFYCLREIYRLGLIQNQLQQIQERLNFKYIKYKAPREPIYEADFMKLRAEPLYKDRLNKLLKNLDLNSQIEVHRIIHRLNLLCDGGKIEFTKAEKLILEEIKENFQQQIFNLRSKIAYREYQFPYGTKIEASVFWYKNGINQLKRKELIEDKAIIDAGAYIGDSALVLSKYFNGKIYSFEAELENLKNMEKVIKWNKLENVVPINSALADIDGEVEFSVGAEESCTYNSIDTLIYDEKNGKKIMVSCTTIDNFVNKYKLDVGLIKVDIEGAEKALIRGAVHTIRTQHPTLIISIYHSIDDFFDIKPMIEEIYSGYSFQIFRPVLEYTFMEETLLICEDLKEQEDEDA